MSTSGEFDQKLIRANHLTLPSTLPSAVSASPPSAPPSLFAISVTNPWGFLIHLGPSPSRFVGASSTRPKINFRQNLGQNLAFREVFDVSVARAVAELRILAEYCLPLVRVGGLFVAAKGHDPLEEVRRAERAIHLMGASVLQMYSDG